MEKELNIAAILKDKSKGTKLWSPIFGECEVRHINDDIDDSISVVSTYSLNSYEFIKDGRASEKGVMCLFPSKKMQDWSKFAWKKGDVLKSPSYLVIFDKWNNDDYTSFIASFGCYRNIDYGKGDTFYTSEFNKASNEEAKEFIKKVEEHYGGKLNIFTLEIEQPKQEFKDGDVVSFDGRFIKRDIFVFEKFEDGQIYSRISLRGNGELFLCKDYFSINIKWSLEKGLLRLATDSEKQQLFSALEKEGKAWDVEKKATVDLPKKCEFKPMDWCLMRDRGEKWKLCQFGFFNKGDGYRDSYNAVGGNWYDECIHYNNSTKHLLGTTDEWKGGEG